MTSYCRIYLVKSYVLQLWCILVQIQSPWKIMFMSCIEVLTSEPVWSIYACSWFLKAIDMPSPFSYYYFFQVKTVLERTKPCFIKQRLLTFPLYFPCWSYLHYQKARIKCLVSFLWYWLLIFSHYFDIVLFMSDDVYSFWYLESVIISIQWKMIEMSAYANYFMSGTEICWWLECYECDESSIWSCNIYAYLLVSYTYVLIAMKCFLSINVEMSAIN